MLLSSIAAWNYDSRYQPKEILVMDPYEQEDDEIASAVAKIPNVTYVNEIGMEMTQAYQLGLSYATGDLINYSLSSSYVSKHTVKKVLKKASKETTALFTIDIKGINNVNDMNKPVSYAMHTRKKGLLNNLNSLKYLNMVLQSYFIRKDVAQRYSFRPELGSSSLHAYLLELLEAEQEIYNIPSVCYTYTELLENTYNAAEIAKEKDWYEDAVRKFLIPFAQEAKKKKGYIPFYLQNAILYLIYTKYECNYFDRDRGILNREESFSFDDAVSELLAYIDDIILFQSYQTNYTISRFLKMHFYRNKYAKLGLPLPKREIGQNSKGFDQFTLAQRADRIPVEEYLGERLDETLTPGLVTMGLVKNQAVTINVIDHINRKAEIDLTINTALFDDLQHQLCAKLIGGAQDKYLELVPTQVYSFVKYFDITIYRQPTFHLSIPLEEFAGKSLAFYVDIEGTEYELKLRFPKVYSRLTKSRASYFMMHKDIYLAYRDEHILCRKKGSFGRLKLELKYFLANIFRGKQNLRKYQYLFLRLLYWICYLPMRKRRIWITFDKLYKGGDDGEYMFRYIMNRQDTDIEIYYVINQDAADYQKLKQEFGKRILTQNSLKLKLLALYSETILATHATVINYLGYSKASQDYIKGLFDAVVVCIQHGLTIQKIAQYQNRIFDDTRLYTLASKYELENVQKPIYGFFGNELKLTGLARYDGLKNSDKKQILITPTWRRNVVNQSIAFIKKTHNSTFKNSEYFRIYNSLINDERLIACARKTGYRLIYLLHPAMSSQAEDFDRNEDVEIVQATGDMSYEQILTESSLMVTDYSGVQFDFAYQRKPIVYYHPQTLPPHYEAGGIDYETMGFGPICKNHEQIIEAICRYMEQNCQTEEEYIRRADDFFAFDDFNSCERIYDVVTDFMRDPVNF